MGALRHRSELIQAATQHVQHMHKSLTQMNLQIHHVISDITGVTGLAIVDAILAGQRDAAELDLHSLNNYTITESSILYFHRNTTGAELTSSKY